VEILIPITFFLSVAAVLILRPISTRLGGFIDAVTRERTTARAEDAHTARILSLMEHMSRRLDMMEERLDFTERLVAEPQRRRIPRRREAEELQRI
jgi:hypothetical protein